MAILYDMLWNAIEASVLALVILLVLRVSKPAAPLRHILWLIVIVKLLAPPLAVTSYCVEGACLRALAHVRSLARVAEPRADPNPDPADPGFSIDGWIPLESGSASDPGEAIFIPPPAMPRDAFLASPIDARVEIEKILPCVAAGIWIAGAAAVFLKAFFRLLRHRRRLARSSVPAPNEIQAQCVEIASRMGLRRVPPVRLIDGRLSPMVWAVGRPTVFLSKVVAASVDRTGLRNLLAHELAHLKRRDHWTAWIDLAAGILYWWLPTLWWLRREIRRSADQAADAWAVWALGSRTEYAESLLQALEVICAGQTSSSQALGLRAGPCLWEATRICAWLGDRKAIERRFSMILRDPLNHRLSRRGLLAAALVGLLVLPAAPERLIGQEPAPPDEVAAAVRPADEPAKDAEAPPPVESARQGCEEADAPATDVEIGAPAEEVASADATRAEELDRAIREAMRWLEKERAAHEAKRREIESRIDALVKQMRVLHEKDARGSKEIADEQVRRQLLDRAAETYRKLKPAGSKETDPAQDRATADALAAVLARIGAEEGTLRKALQDSLLRSLDAPKPERDEVAAMRAQVDAFEQKLQMFRDEFRASMEAFRREYETRYLGTTDPMSSFKRTTAIEPARPDIGRAMVEFPKTLWLHSKPLSASDLRGKIVLLYFWAHWCPESLKELERLEVPVREAIDAGVAVIGVHAASGSLQEMSAVGTGLRPVFPICIDVPVPAPDGRGHGSLGNAYGIPRVPFAVLIDAEGKISGQGDLGSMVEAASLVRGRR